jgi:hypothetical protein
MAWQTPSEHADQAARQAALDLDTLLAEFDPSTTKPEPAEESAEQFVADIALDNSALVDRVDEITRTHAIEKAGRDLNATEDRYAVADAVHGASANAPQEGPVSYGRLSNAEFARDVTDKFGFDPGV